MKMVTFDNLKKIVTHKYFEAFILSTIILAGILVGIQTYPDFSAKHHNLIAILDTLIITIFIIEAILKIASEMPHPIKYFKNSWNVFDFVIVIGVLLPLGGSFLPVLRLLRVLRVFRVITVVPKMRLIVGALLKSIPSMIHVFMLLGIIFYIYAVMGTFAFSENDPIHFENLQTSLLTLFRIVTFEDWTDVMYINMYGCDQYGYDNARLECTNPSASPIGAALYFTSFVLIGGLIVLNFAIGVVINSMDEMKEEMVNEYPAYNKLAEKGKQENIIERLNKMDEKLDAILYERSP
ncbi:ion transporter [Methanolobus bombayensis]|uniref:ion transporter n=1 Tax=Methanolobus bombayensis TaxID=38023 RepID=UPI001AE13EE6|nr:ion transporter [Methanolobus bombayensis]MBP1908937.1 voltage-gated sodium channel [Methanolobus bombayensis]